MVDVFHFLWTVPKEGFLWLDAPSGSYLTNGKPASVMWEATRYAPLIRDPALFRTFASTEPSKDGILAFANKYGQLGLPSPIEVTYEGETVLGAGERLRLWQDEIEAMKRALDVWDLLRRRDDDALRRQIQTGPDWARWVLDPQPTSSVVFHNIYDKSHNVRPELAGLVQADDVARPAMFYLQLVIDERLDQHVHARVLYSEEEDRPRLRVVPQDLLGALWFEFALALDGNREYRRCAECGTWFEINPNYARKNKLYCSTTCRVRFFRKKVVTNG